MNPWEHRVCESKSVQKGGSPYLFLEEMLCPTQSCSHMQYSGKSINPQCHRMGRDTLQTSADNWVELNVNDGRVNVNNNWSDNPNDNVWSSAARHFLLFSFSSIIALGGGAYLFVLLPI